MMDDNVRVAYANMYKTKDRAELDGRNSSGRPPDCFELASKLYNDDQYNPQTLVFPCLHQDFEQSLTLYAIDAPMVNPQKLKEKWADVRGKLVIIVANYEKSGNGSGNRLDSEEDHGQTSSFTLTDNNDRQNFLGTHKPHLLYFWQLLDDYDLLKTTLMVLPHDTAATTDCVPLTVSYSTPSRKNPN
jgi:hypothetical protein